MSIRYEEVYIEEETLPNFTRLSPEIQNGVLVYPRYWNTKNEDNEYPTLSSLGGIVMALSKNRSPLFNNLLGFEKRMIDGKNRMVYFMEKETVPVSSVTNDTAFNFYIRQFIAVSAACDKLGYQLVYSDSVSIAASGDLVLDNMAEFSFSWRTVFNKFSLNHFISVLLGSPKLREIFDHWYNRMGSDADMFGNPGLPPIQQIRDLRVPGLTEEWINHMFEETDEHRYVPKLAVSMGIVLPEFRILKSVSGPYPVPSSFGILFVDSNDMFKDENQEETLRTARVVLTWCNGSLTSQQYVLIYQICRVLQESLESSGSGLKLEEVLPSEIMTKFNEEFRKTLGTLRNTKTILEYTYLVMKSLGGVLP